MPSSPVIIWYLLVCLGIYEACRGAGFKRWEGLFYGFLWPISLPFMGLFVAGLQIVDWIRQIVDWIRDR